MSFGCWGNGLNGIYDILKWLIKIVELTRIYQIIWSACPHTSTTTEKGEALKFKKVNSAIGVGTQITFSGYLASIVQL